MGQLTRSRDQREGGGDGKGAHSRQAKQINKRWGNGGGDLDMDNIAYQCNRNPLWLQIYRPALQSLPYQRDGGRLPAPLLHSRRGTHTYMFTYTYKSCLRLTATS